MNQDALFSQDVCRIRDPQYCAPRAESLLVEHATLDLLDSHRLSFFLDVKESENPTLARVSRSHQMHMLGLSCDGTPTIAAMLHFCPYPQGFFPQFIFGCAVVDDTDWVEEHVTLRKKITGSITDLYEQALAFCEKHAPACPREVISELLINSLIHRDYSEEALRSSNYIIIFKDRLEIWSPYPEETFTVPEYKAYTAPKLPNPTIASIAQVLLQTRLTGSGIKSVQEGLKQARLPDLEYEVDCAELGAIVRFARSIAEDDTDRLLDFCSIPRSRQEIADFLQVGTIFYAMQRYVKPLIEAGKLKMTMPDKPQSSKQRFVRK